MAGGAWDHTADDWRSLVLDAIDRLPLDSATPEYLEAAGSLALLALSSVQNTLSPWERGLMELRFDRTVQQVADLVVEATAERIEEYADGLTGRFPASTRPEIALAIVDKLTADPLDNVLNELAEHGISAERIGRVIDLAKRVPNPLLGALWALAACEKAAPLAVRCASADGKFANVFWRPPDLLVIESPKPHACWTRRYEYPSGRRPGADIRLNNKLDGDRCKATTSISDPLPALATELLAEFQLSEPGPPD